MLTTSLPPPPPLPYPLLPSVPGTPTGVTATRNGYDYATPSTETPIAVYEVFCQLTGRER